MNRNVTFTFAAGTPTGNQTATSSLILSVVDAAGTSLFGPTRFPPTGTTTTLSLPVGTGYKATLVAQDVNFASDPTPPTVAFDVTPPPPPPAPADPTLQPPVMA